MDLICTELVETYNTNILDKVDKEIKETFVKESKKGIGTGIGRQTLMNLISHHEFRRLIAPTPHLIGGPKSLTVHWSAKYKKMIYIFGEHHSDRIDCKKRFPEFWSQQIDTPGTKIMSIEYFLAELINKSDVFIDLFFEFPYGQYSENFKPFPSNYRLDKLLNKFRKCLYFATRDKDCDLARIHYFDTRFSVEENGMEDTPSNDLNYCEDVFTLVNRGFKREEYARVLNSILEEDEIVKKTLESLHKIEFVLEQFESKTNTKDLPTTIDTDISDKIKSFFEKETVDTFLSVKWEENINIILENDKHTEEELYNAFITIYEKLGVINSLAPDMYLMSRVFKIFDMNKIKEKAHANATDQPSQARNIIIYAGDFHAQTYRKFLKVLNFDRIEKAGKLEKFRVVGEPIHCINMNTISQPFFSKWPPK